MLAETFNTVKPSTEGPHFIKAILCDDSKYSLIDVIDGNLVWRKGYGLSNIYTYNDATLNVVLMINEFIRGLNDKPSIQACSWREFNRQIKFSNQFIITANTPQGSLIDIEISHIKLLNILKKLTPAALKKLQSVKDYDELAPATAAAKDILAEDIEIEREPGHEGEVNGEDSGENAEDNRINQESEESDEDNRKGSESDEESDEC